tara:strand:+ start:418 stop:777 length:360 start_codon:yes stop_codon:yes gene_type:complete
MIVKLYITQIVPNVPIYHVGIGFKNKNQENRYDFHPKKFKLFEPVVTHKTKNIKLGLTLRNEFEINEFEKSLNKNYFLFFNDCRHYCQQMINFSGIPDIQLTNPFYLNSLFQTVDHNIE